MIYEVHKVVDYPAGQYLVSEKAEKTFKNLHDAVTYCELFKGLEYYVIIERFEFNVG